MDKITRAKNSNSYYSDSVVTIDDLAIMIARSFSSFEMNMNSRFEVIDRKFEAIDKRFEEIDRKFEAIDKRFESLEQNMNKRFDSLENKMFLFGSRTSLLETRVGALES